MMMMVEKEKKTINEKIQSKERKEKRRRK